MRWEGNTERFDPPYQNRGILSVYTKMRRGILSGVGGGGGLILYSETDRGPSPTPPSPSVKNICCILVTFKVSKCNLSASGYFFKSDEYMDRELGNYKKSFPAFWAHSK